MKILYIAIGILVVLSLRIIRHILRIGMAGKDMKIVEKAALQVRIAAFARLTKRYEPKYDSRSEVLARAVTNELFSDVSQDDTPAGVFLRNHGEVLHEELSKLTDDEELLRMVHTTLSEEIGIRHAYGATAEQIEETPNKLKRFGLLVPADGATADEFVTLANEFYRDNVSG